MAFSKAQPQQARLKVSIYGPPGSGKTFTTLLMAEGLAKYRGKRIAYVDTEHGTDFYVKDVPERKVHPHAFDIDTVYTRSLAVAGKEIYGLDPAVHGVVIVDSWSHIWEAAIDAYEGTKTSVDSIPMHAWGKIKKPYKALLNHLMGSMYDVFILGRQKNIFGEDSKGDLVKTGVAMKAEGETAYEPHICLRMESERHPDDQNKSRPMLYAEKDRTGILQGHVIPWPNFGTIAPLLPYLGEVQAPADDDEERIAGDHEAMNAMDEAKSKSREAKSTAIFADLSARAAAAKNSDDLGSVGADFKKQKRYIHEVHEAALRELFTAARDRIFPKTA